MKVFGIDRLARDVAAEAAARMHSVYTSLTAGDSPIEKLLFIAADWRLGQAHVPYSLYRSIVPAGALAHPDGAEVLVSTQEVLIGTWPVDFVYRVWFGSRERSWHLIIVECDGHDFHERTKEQAARDRSRDRELQALGHTVLRFTGSEIFKDALKCADELMAEIFRHLHEGDNA